MKKVCMFVADGLEECEGLITVDILRRAGIEVTMASIMETKTIHSSHGVTFETEALARDLASSPQGFEAFDMLILPGGYKGTQNLKKSRIVAEAVTDFLGRPEEKMVAAICAAPTVLGVLGLLKGRRATCYPGCENGLTGADYTAEPVTEDGNLITGNGLGAAIPFALHIVARLEGQEKAEEVREKIQYPFAV